MDDDEKGKDSHIDPAGNKLKKNMFIAFRQTQAFLKLKHTEHFRGGWRDSRNGLWITRLGAACQIGE